MIKALLFGDKIFSVSGEAFSLQQKSFFGEKKNNKIEYSSIEALFLMQEGKMTVFFGEKPIQFDSLLKKLKKRDKKIETKFCVFSDMRKKGHIVKSALKFGAEFRVYDKGDFPGKDHAKWILYTVRESDLMNWHDFAAKNRVAHSTKKNLLIGIVDDEGDASYYEIAWMKP